MHFVPHRKAREGGCVVLSQPTATTAGTQSSAPFPTAALFTFAQSQLDVTVDGVTHPRSDRRVSVTMRKILRSGVCTCAWPEECDTAVAAARGASVKRSTVDALIALEYTPVVACEFLDSVKFLTGCGFPYMKTPQERTQSCHRCTTGKSASSSRRRSSARTRQRAQRRGATAQLRLPSRSRLAAGAEARAGRRTQRRLRGRRRRRQRWSWSTSGACMRCAGVRTLHPKLAATFRIEVPQGVITTSQSHNRNSTSYPRTAGDRPALLSDALRSVAGCAGVSPEPVPGCAFTSCEPASSPLGCQRDRACERTRSNAPLSRRASRRVRGAGRRVRQREVPGCPRVRGGAGVRV